MFSFKIHMPVKPSVSQKFPQDSTVIHPFLPLHPRQLMICFLPLQISPHLLGFLYKRNHMVFLVWVFYSVIILRIIHFAACINSSFLSIAEPYVVRLYHYFSIHLLIDIWVVSSLGILQIKLVWVFVHNSVDIWRHIYVV